MTMCGMTREELSIPCKACGWKSFIENGEQMKCPGCGNVIDSEGRKLTFIEETGDFVLLRRY